MLVVSRRLWAVSRWTASAQEKLCACRGEMTVGGQKAKGWGSKLLCTAGCRFPSAEAGSCGWLSLWVDENQGVYRVASHTAWTVRRLTWISTCPSGKADALQCWCLVVDIFINGSWMKVLVFCFFVICFNFFPLRHKSHLAILTLTLKVG